MSDLGCGSGRALLWNRDLGADVIGIDIAPFFSHDARQQIDLLLGDLRQLPFADNTFDKAWSLDVLEHLSPDALDGMLAEAARVLKPGGALFVYTHVRKNAPVAAGLKWINTLARQLERWDLIDLRQERLRKSDHLNPLRDVPHLERVVARGRVPHPAHPLLHADRRRLRREHHDADGRAGDGAPARRARLAGERPPEADAAAIREARTAAKERIAGSGRPTRRCAALSLAMKLDLLLFGRIRSGPFFALLVKKTEDAHPLRRDRPDGARHQGWFRPRHGGGGGLAALGHEVHVLVDAGRRPFPAGRCAGSRCARRSARTSCAGRGAAR